MKDEILKLEAVAKKLEPDSKRRRALMDTTYQYSDMFLESLPNEKAYNNNYHPMSELDAWVPGRCLEDLPSILSFIKRNVDDIGINAASPGHLGYIPGGGIYASSLGDFLAAVVNKYAGLYFGGPGAVKLENKLLRWTADLIGYPDTALGNITSGGSIANLIAVTTARDDKHITPERINKSVIYYTQQTHHCVNKAVRIAGLYECHRRRIKVDDNFRLEVKDLRRQVKEDVDNGLNPFFLAASTGSTDTGAADPLEAIADVCEEFNIWFHLDAAYGGFFILVDELKHFFKGIERTDSIALDPHKSLFMPYGIGIVLVKNGQALYESQHYMANYLQDAYDGREEISPCELSPELTKHFRGLRMWIPLELYGVDTFAAGLKEKWLLARYFHFEVQKIGFEAGPPPDLSVCIYRYVPEKGEANAFNQELVNLIQNDGRIFISSTTIDDIIWLRVGILCFRTHLNEIDLYLKILKEKSDLLISQSS